jgi:hypothetical protein
MLGRKVILIGISFLVFFLMFTVCSAQDSLELLLPKEGEVREWKRVDNPLIYAAENLYDFIDGGAEIFLEYGFQKVISQEYQNKDLTIIATIYQMDNEVSAFGIFSDNRSARFKNITIGNGGFRTDYSLNFWQYNYYIVVESFQKSPLISDALVKFSKLISRKINQKAEKLTVLSLLPERGLVKESIKLVKGILAINNTYYFTEKDIFQLRDGDIGLFADYNTDGQNTRLFLIKYESESKAQAVFVRIQDFFNSNKDYKVSKPEHDILSWKKQDIYFSLIIKGSLVGLALEAKDKLSSQNLLLLLKQ